MKREAITLVLCAALGLAAEAGAADTRFKLSVNGTYSALKQDYSESRTFTEFAEAGSYDVSYSDKAGPGLDLGLQYDLTDHLGVALGYTLVSRDGTGSFTGRIPHPLYLNQPRQVSGDLGDRKYKEQAGHLDLVYFGRSGSLGFGVFAGVTVFRVEADLLDTVQYTQTYPYDTATVTGATKTAASATPIGFNVGAGLDYHIGTNFGLGLQLRFSRGSAELVPSEGNKVSIDAGGLQVSAGARVFF